MRARGHDDDPVAKPRHHVDVVLDQEEGHAGRVDRADAVDQHLQQRGVHPGGGLVQKDHLRVGHHHPRQFQELALPAGQDAGGLVGQLVQKHHRQDVAGLPGRRPFLGGDAAGRQEAGPDMLAGLTLPRQQQVVDQRQFREGPRDLEGPPQPARQPAVRGIGGHVPPGKGDPARSGRHRPGQQVEHRGLARAVRADQAEDLALPHGQRHRIHGRHAAEALRQRPGLQYRGCRHRPSLMFDL